MKRLGCLAAMLLMLLAGCASRQAPSAYDGWFNPLPNSDEVAARGRLLFRVHCAACHGNRLDGRGPMATTLTTRPTDLRELSVPDVEIYESISLGKGESMPGFRNQLNAYDRAALVRYLERVNNNRRLRANRR